MAWPQAMTDEGDHGGAPVIDGPLGTAAPTKSIVTLRRGGCPHPPAGCICTQRDPPSSSPTGHLPYPFSPLGTFPPDKGNRPQRGRQVRTAIENAPLAPPVGELAAELTERAGGQRPPLQEGRRFAVGAAVLSGPPSAYAPNETHPHPVPAGPPSPWKGEGYIRSHTTAQNPSAFPSSAPVCPLGHLPPGEG